MRIGWVGFHSEGLPALRAVLEQGVRLEAVLTLEPSLAVRKSGAIDYGSLCRDFGVPLYEIRNINNPPTVALLKALSLDLVFVIGWTQLVRREAMQQVRVGMLGAHASLLPSFRGRAPINWALIRGAQQTGNTLMWLAEQADRGDIIDQTVIPIQPYDTCATLYGKVAETNKSMILRVLPRLLAGQRPGRPQPEGDGPDLPARRPEDGVVNWADGAVQVYDFIRALTKPYPGAISWLDGRRFRLWECALLPGLCSAGASAGRILGAVVSPREDACGQAVACQTGSLVVLEMEDDQGNVLRGRRLSDQCWEGKVLTHE